MYSPCMQYHAHCLLLHSSSWVPGWLGHGTLHSSPQQYIDTPGRTRMGCQRTPCRMAEQRKSEPVRTKRGTRPCKLGACARG